MLNPQDRDETETFDFSKLSRPRRDRDVQPSRPRRDVPKKTSRDRLETETFKTETTSLSWGSSFQTHAIIWLHWLQGSALYSILATVAWEVIICSIQTMNFLSNCGIHLSMVIKLQQVIKFNTSLPNHPVGVTSSHLLDGFPTVIVDCSLKTAYFGFHGGALWDQCCAIF